MQHIGSFSGILILRPAVDITYLSTQMVNVIVSQNNIILSKVQIKNIDNIVGQKFSITYEYQNFVNPIQLIIQSLVDDDQFNKDNPIELINLEIDNLYTIKKFTTYGAIMNKNNQCVDTGNYLYDTGQLVYTFNIPVFREVVIG